MGTFGRLFETLVMRDLLAYSSASTAGAASLSYYLDEKRKGCDAILERPDGRWAAIDIRIGDLKTTADDAARIIDLSGRVFASRIGGARLPSFLAFTTACEQIA